jgi:hypothetical protein
MKRPSSSLVAVACVVAFVLPATSLLGVKQQKTGAKRILVEAKSSLSESDHVLSAETGKSAPEMERLKFYLGTWDYTETYPKSTFSPKGGQNAGVYTSKLGPGGNSLENTFHSQGPVGDFEGLLIMTWDAKEKSYKSYTFGNDFSGCFVQTGSFEGDALVYRGDLAMGEQHIALRNSTRFIAPNRISSDEFSAANGQPEKLLVHVEAVKRAEK